MQMLWFPITLLCAFSLATSDAVTKKALAARYNEYLVAWLRLLLTVPFFASLALSVPRPPLGHPFFLTLAAALPLELAALILYFKALKLSPLGLTVPFLALTPIFLLVVPYLLLGERISLQGGCGVLLIATGAYTLNLRRGEAGWLGPFRAILRERGSLCMMAVAVLYSFTATLCKRGISLSAPLFFAGLYPVLLFFCLTPVALWKGRKELRHIYRSGILKAALLPALFSFVEFVTNIVAMSLTQVAYMIAVKRVSLLMGVLYGHFLFQEGDLRDRLAGGVLMMAGVILIVSGAG